MTRFCVFFRKDNAVLAEADIQDVIQIEGNYYFPPAYVHLDKLETSDRAYNCPKKGVCLWVDMKVNNSWINNVSWIYSETVKEYDKINGYYGFYGNHPAYEVRECN